MELKKYKYDNAPTRNDETGEVSISLMLTLSTKDGNIEFEKDINMVVVLPKEVVIPIEVYIKEAIDSRIKSL